MDDLISRQAAIDALGERPYVWTETEYELGQANQWDSDVAAIKALPSAQPERKKGKWIEATADGIVTFDKNAYAQCSVCEKKEFLGWRKNFCPHCGSDMRCTKLGKGE